MCIVKIVFSACAIQVRARAFSKCQIRALASRKSLLAENDTDRDLQRSQIRLVEESILQLEQRLDSLEDAMAEMNIHIAEGRWQLIRVEVFM